MNGSSSIISIITVSIHYEFSGMPSESTVDSPRKHHNFTTVKGRYRSVKIRLGLFALEVYQSPLIGIRDIKMYRACPLTHGGRKLTPDASHVAVMHLKPMESPFSHFISLSISQSHFKFLQRVKQFYNISRLVSRQI
jgi:hypothetical protein